jgi:hypothetical protein
MRNMYHTHDMHERLQRYDLSFPFSHPRPVVSVNLKFSPLFSPLPVLLVDLEHLQRCSVL